MIAELMPESALERELVERLVLRRLRRIPAFEAALMAWLKKLEEDGDPLGDFLAGGRGDRNDQLLLGRTIEMQGRRKHASESQDALPAPK